MHFLACGATLPDQKPDFACPKYAVALSYLGVEERLTSAATRPWTPTRLPQASAARGAELCFKDHGNGPLPGLLREALDGGHIRHTLFLPHLASSLTAGRIWPRGTEPCLPPATRPATCPTVSSARRCAIRPTSALFCSRPCRP